MYSTLHVLIGTIIIKCSQRGYALLKLIFLIVEPIRPLDPSAWVMHTNAQRGKYFNINFYYYLPYAYISPEFIYFSKFTCSIFCSSAGEYGRPFTGSPTLSTMTSNSSPSLASSIPESERDLVKLNLTSPLYRVAKAMAQSDSGLEVKDRMWLKMPIPKSFIGQYILGYLSITLYVL